MSRLGAEACRALVNRFAVVARRAWREVGRHRHLRLVDWHPKGWRGNFGDELSRRVVTAMLDRRGLRADEGGKRLLAVGSILHFAADGDVVWGSGRNGKIAESAHRARLLDVRAVRGPLTREFLLGLGIPCPEVFGDPALLLPRLSRWRVPGRGRKPFVILPNLHDLGWFLEQPECAPNVVSPLSSVRRCLSRILSSELVVSSSLHGLVVAEAYGIRAQLLLPPCHAEPIFKYEDYYLSSGRGSFHVARDLREALSFGGEEIVLPDLDRLEAAFPWDLFGVSRGAENRRAAARGPA